MLLHEFGCAQDKMIVMLHAQYVLTCPEHFARDITSADAQTLGSSRGVPPEEQE